MTTKFDTKEQALNEACKFAGVGIEALKGIVPKAEAMYYPVFMETECKEIEVYTFKNKNGEDVSFALSKFRDGFDLWLVSETGLMMRI